MHTTNNRLTTDELISFGFCDRSVRSLDSISESFSERFAESNEKNDFTFSLIFGLSQNLGLSER